MIAAALLILIVLLLATTPWRRLPRAARLWTVVAVLKTVVFFGLPITPATSPWRPVITPARVVSAALSFVLLALGLLLRHRYSAVGSSNWTGPLVLCALPALFYGFFWLIGPLY
jgi:hypothetical protein